MVKLMKAKLVKESVEDILRPKSDREIVEEFSDEILMDLQSGDAVSFYKSWGTSDHKFAVYKSSYQINESFDKFHKEHGPGLYVAKSIKTKTSKIPLEHIFPHKFIYGKSMLKIDVPAQKLDMAVRELVADAYVNEELGDGFHLKYYNPLNENLFKPKTEEEIIKNIAREIRKEFEDKSMALTLKLGVKPEISNAGVQLMDKKYYEHGPGIYISVDDDSRYTAENVLIKYMTIFKRIGHSTYHIPGNCKEKCILKDLVKKVLDKEIDFFIIKKYDE
jgi:hypothetical protein